MIVNSNRRIEYRRPVTGGRGASLPGPGDGRREQALLRTRDRGVEIEKTIVNKKTHSVAALTVAGRAAFEEYKEKMKEVLK